MYRNFLRVLGFLTFSTLLYAPMANTDPISVKQNRKQDISDASTVRFAAFGDYGDAGTAEAAVASLVGSLTPDFIITTGDNSYGSNDIDDNIGQYYSSYIGNYTGSYGSGTVPNRFFTSLGNHDWYDGGGVAAYLAYFTLPDSGILDTNTSDNERYYDFVRGSVHFFAVDSDLNEPDGYDSTSTQALWLKTQLAASTAVWKVVYFHHAPYSSSSVHGSQMFMRWPFEDWGVDAVFSGHDHVYERLLVDQNNDGSTIPYFVTGVGGHGLYAFGTPLPESIERYNSDFGTMLVEATDTYMNFKFYSINSTHGSNGLIDEYQVPDTIYAVTVQVDSGGIVELEPDLAGYGLGDTVIVTAVPEDTTWTFHSWSGDLTGTVNPETLIVTGNMTVKAHFRKTSTGVVNVTPTHAALHQNHPNPFNPTTTIEFALHREALVTLSIFDVSGRLVRTLMHRRMRAGLYEEVWDGRDGGGQPAATGVYFYRLNTGEIVLTRKAVLLK